MTAANFDEALSLVLAHEGGYSDHPKDPGGATMRGVTQKVYDDYRIRHGKPWGDVKRITNTELQDIYRDGYWRAIRADDMPPGVDYALFDYAVNSGPGRAVKDLQRALGTKVDGVIGVNTLALMEHGENEKIIRAVCAGRLKFLKSLRHWSTFGPGWERRVREVEAAALEMCAGAAVTAPTRPATLAQAVKAPEAATAQMKTADGQGLSLVAAGAGGEKVRQFAEQVQPHIGLDTVLGRLAFAVFTLLMLIGGCLLGYAYIRRIKEAGGLGGFVGSVFKGTSP